MPCQEGPQPAKSEPVSYTSNADVLFAFGESDLASITSLGREEMRKVAKQIRERSPSTATRVTVRGHADPIGSAESNMVLSEQRASTVARVLSEEGLDAERISIEGVGSAEAVVSCSTSGSKLARVACNAPNRRVQVVVSGVAAK